MGQTQHTESPEATGLYTCFACGNREHFIGIDHNGTAGKVDDCDECTPGVGMYCECPTVLTQPFSVEPDQTDEERQQRDPNGHHPAANVDYQSHEGGASGAEIGSYTQINCATCGAILWNEVPPE